MYVWKNPDSGFGKYFSGLTKSWFSLGKILIQAWEKSDLNLGKSWLKFEWILSRENWIKRVWKFWILVKFGKILFMLGIILIQDLENTIQAWENINAGLENSWFGLEKILIRLDEILIRVWENSVTTTFRFRDLWRSLEPPGHKLEKRLEQSTTFGRILVRLGRKVKEVLLTLPNIRFFQTVLLNVFDMKLEAFGTSFTDPLKKLKEG